MTYTDSTTLIFDSSNIVVSQIDRIEYERQLAERQHQHLQNIQANKDANWRPCLHDSCSQCHGTGVTAYGPCVHGISCPCPKCTPTF